VKVSSCGPAGNLHFTKRFEAVTDSPEAEPCHVGDHVTAVDLDSVRAAAARVLGLLHRTPILSSEFIDRRSGRQLFLKCENFQRTGSFKLRGALNAVLNLKTALAARGVLTASSGNFGQGLAWAARHRGVPAHVVMPADVPKVKRAAVQALGATIHTCEPTLADRDRLRKKVYSETGATFISSHDHPDVIAGQGTIVLELLDQVSALDAIVAPIGGGGLISGIAVAAKALRPEIRVIGVEPDGAADAARSKAEGKLVLEPNPQTIAKGLLIGLGEITWYFVRDLVDDVVTVDDDAIVRAMRLVWEQMNIVIEPSAAVSIAAVVSPEFREHSELRRVAIVLSGGNVDLDDLPW
jgi:threonine dehydratase